MANLPGVIGTTTPGSTNWQAYTGPTADTSGLYVDIDYTSAGFTKVPVVIPVLVGSLDNWVMQVSASGITAVGCRVYIRSTLPGFHPTATLANTNYWAIQWVAVANGIGFGTTVTTMPYNPCDNA